jgi:hypothetical protein
MQHKNVPVRCSTRDIKYSAHHMVSFATSVLDESDVIKLMQGTNEARLNLQLPLF